MLPAFFYGERMVSVKAASVQIWLNARKSLRARAFFAERAQILLNARISQ